jgi:hypothetical protein
MASKNLQYKVNGVPNKEDIENFDKDSSIFYRFQNPYNRLTSRSQSWGMIFGSKAEALRDCEEWGMTKEEAILNGKSCMLTFDEILNFSSEFSYDDVLLIFEGSETNETGHDGELVATYYKKIAVWNKIDVSNYANKIYE